MRPLTDQEWFAEISSTDHKASAERKGEIKATAGTDLHKAKSHLAGMTSSRRGKPSSYEGVTSSVSASSAGSANNSNDVARQTQTRQMRDQVVQSITRRRVREARQSRDDGEAQDGIEAPMMAQHMTSGASSSRTGENPVSEANKPDGERIIGAMGDSVEQDDPNAGQYVNYQIGFEYIRKESTHRKGWGLHVLVSDLRHSGQVLMKITGVLWNRRQGRRQGGNTSLHRHALGQRHRQCANSPLGYSAIRTQCNGLAPIPTRF